jgi:hypothetical protein
MTILKAVFALHGKGFFYYNLLEITFFDNRRQRPDEKLLPKRNWQYDRVSGAAATGCAEGRGTRY